MTILLESAIRVTLIAAAVAMVLFAMRIKTAAVLHALWTGIVVLMLLLPAWVAWGPKAPLPILPADRTRVVALLPPPLPAGLADATPPISPVPNPVREDGGYSVVTAVYLLGLAVLLLRLAIGTVRANRLTSASCVVPVTVGLLHPRIILPDCSRDWPQAQLDAVLAHEGEHIRRRDPLFQWLALVNRALFWFHPLAWWLELRLSGLAEEACDVAVIARGYDPRAYSEYLLDLAKSVQRAGTRIEAVGMAMPGIGLRHRIRRMLSGVPVPRISRPRMACTVAVCAAAAVILAAGTLIRAQSKTAGAPKWEVASIRSCQDFGQGERGANKNLSQNRMTLYCYVLQSVIVSAYLQFADGVDVSSDPELVLAPPIEGGPSWINSERFTITAKAESNASPGMMQGPMLQALLEDRFKLKAHFEMKQEQPAYALTVAKGGPKLKPFVEGSCTRRDNILLTPQPGDCLRKNSFNEGNIVIDEQGITIEEFRYIYLRRSPFNGIDRPVVDRTGLTGRYDIHLENALSTPPALRQANGDDKAPTGPSLFTALQEQLGLKLEPIKAPKNFLVIDHIERPSED
jgi:bla regulator protein blaR1